jgi:serine/threonine-protein kinase
MKPANICTCRLGLECDFIKVLDFGLVKTERNVPVDVTRLTQQGIACGTPGYMAPEAALAKADIDARADLYALGCVGYWLVTGQLVLEADSSLGMALQHVQSIPVPPSQRTEIDIPESFEKAILSCLEKDPIRRPQSAQELDSLLVRCESKGSWTPATAKEWWDLRMPEQTPQWREGTDRDPEADESPLGILHPERPTGSES